MMFTFLFERVTLKHPLPGPIGPAVVILGVSLYLLIVIALRPDLRKTTLAKPLTMLLFGMINWMFIWMRPDGELDYDAMAPVVADLFLGGLPGVRLPRRVVQADA